MKPEALVEWLQKLLAEHPEIANRDVRVTMQIGPRTYRRGVVGQPWVSEMGTLMFPAYSDEVR